MTNPAASRRLIQDRSRATRADITLAALHLFLDQGFEATAVEDICQRACISKGAFYYHFASKEAILAELAYEDGRLLQTTFEEALASEAPTGELAALVARLFLSGLAAQPSAVLRSTTQEMVRAWARGPGFQSPLFDNYLAVARRGVQRGDLTAAVAAEDVAFVLLGATVASLLAWLAEPAPPPSSTLETVVVERLRWVLRG